MRTAAAGLNMNPAAVGGLLRPKLHANAVYRKMSRYQRGGALMQFAKRAQKYSQTDCGRRCAARPPGGLLHLKPLIDNGHGAVPRAG